MKWDVYETGTWDYQKIIFSVLKETNQKLFSTVAIKYDQNSFNKAP